MGRGMGRGDGVFVPGMIAGQDGVLYGLYACMMIMMIGGWWWRRVCVCV
jgi:hypothetical protein